MPRCQGKTKKELRCKNQASKQNPCFCVQHLLQDKRPFPEAPFANPVAIAIPANLEPVEALEVDFDRLALEETEGYLLCTAENCYHWTKDEDTLDDGGHPCPCPKTYVKEEEKDGDVTYCCLYEGCDFTHTNLLRVLDHQQEEECKKFILVDQLGLSVETAISP